MIGKREKSLEEREEAWKEEWYRRVSNADLQWKACCRLCRRGNYLFIVWIETSQGVWYRRLYKLRRHWQRKHTD